MSRVGLDWEKTEGAGVAAATLNTLVGAEGIMPYVLISTQIRMVSDSGLGLQSEGRKKSEREIKHAVIFGMLNFY